MGAGAGAGAGAEAGAGAGQVRGGRDMREHLIRFKRTQVHSASKSLEPLTKADRPLGCHWTECICSLYSTYACLQNITPINTNLIHSSWSASAGERDNTSTSSAYFDVSMALLY